MDEGFGGPVWHASVMNSGSVFTAQLLARRALDGVGDASLGEWNDERKAVHIRRRLSALEEAASGLSMRDLRGQGEGMTRLNKLFAQFPHLKKYAVMSGEWQETVSAATANRAASKL